MDDLEKAARALCVVEGVDPDAQFQTNEAETIRQENSWNLQYKKIPQWEKKLPEAKRFVAVLKALGVPIGR